MTILDCCTMRASSLHAVHTARKTLGQRQVNLAIAQVVRVSNRVVDFAAMNGHIFWCFDPQADFIAANFNNRDTDVLTDNNRLTLLP